MFKRGGIYAIRLHRADGGEPDICPCLVVSNNISNEFSPVVTIIPLSFTNLDNIYEFETLLPSVKSGLDQDAKISSHVLITIDKTSVVGERMGFLNKTVMDKVEKALRLQLGLDDTPVSTKG